MLPFRPALLMLALLALPGCATPTGPVEVTRFHDPAALARLGQGTISVEAAPGAPGDSLEMQSYQAAVARELVKLGYSEASDGKSAQVAQVRVERMPFQPTRSSSPVSVGVGGSTGSYGSGVGLGIGFDLSGPPPQQLITQMQVTIRERASNPSFGQPLGQPLGQTLWEGRASFTVRADAPLAQSQLGAARIAEALFRNFPGNSGETIEVR